jgi:hypothetical protein
MGNSGRNSFNSDFYAWQRWRDQIHAHIENGQMTRGLGWASGRGGFIGCSVHSYNYELFSNSLKLPKEIGEIAEDLFDSCHDDKSAAMFAESVVEATGVGVNYWGFLNRWCLWLLLDQNHGLVPYTLEDDMVHSIGMMHEEALSDGVSIERWKTAATESTALVTKAKNIVENIASRHPLDRVAACTAIANESAILAASYAAIRASSEHAVHALQAANRAAARATAYAYVSLDARDIDDDDLDEAIETHTSLAMAAQRRQFLSMLESEIFPAA